MASIRFGGRTFGRSWIFGGTGGSSGGGGPVPGETTTARPGEYAVKVYNADGTKLAEWGSAVQNNQVLSLTFELLETGCGAFEMKLGELPPIANLNYGMRLDIHLFGDAAPWYSGYVIERPVSGTTAKPYIFKGFGYFQQLDWVLVNETYEYLDIATIAKMILQTYVEPDTKITYSASKITTVGYQAVKLRFDNVTAKEALKQLSEFATGYVYGVDEKREFFFRPVRSSVNEQARLFVGVHVNEFMPTEDLTDLCNYAKIKGAKLDANGSNILATVQSADSQAIYGMRKKVFDIPSAVAEADALRWGQAELDQVKYPKQRATIKGLKLEYPNADGTYNVRRIKPDGRAAITAQAEFYETTGPATWNELPLSWNDYATETWNSLFVTRSTAKGPQTHYYPITKVKYSISSGGVIADLTLGDPPKSLMDWFVDVSRAQKNSDYVQAANNVQLSGGSL